MFPPPVSLNLSIFLPLHHKTFTLSIHFLQLAPLCPSTYPLTPTQHTPESCSLSHSQGHLKALPRTYIFLSSAPPLLNLSQAYTFSLIALSLLSTSVSKYTSWNPPPSTTHHAEEHGSASASQEGKKSPTDSYDLRSSGKYNSFNPIHNINQLFMTDPRSHYHRQR